MVNRTFLYWGVFLVAAGAVLLTAQAGLITPDGVRAGLQLWPVAVIAVGGALVLRRTPLSLAGGLVAAAMPGLVLGGVAVAVPDIRPDCHVVQPSGYAARTGAFESPAHVNLQLVCGSLDIGVTPGSGWQVQVGNTGAPAPTIDAAPDSLSVRSANRSHPFGVGPGDVWHVSLPASQRLDLAATIDAATSRLELGGAQIGTLELTVNAGDLKADLTSATVDGASLHVNAGAARIVLPDTDLAVDVHVNAGKATLCAPPDLGLRVQQDVRLGSTHLAGLVRDGEAWQSPDYATTTHHADVTLAVNVGSVDINPEGGCK